MKGWQFVVGKCMSRLPAVKLALKFKFSLLV